MSKSKNNILIVDDNEEVLTALGMYLSKYFESVITENNSNRIIKILENQAIDLVILDMNFSAGINTGNEGIFWMREIHKFDPSIIVIMITAYGDIDLAVKAVKEGATDFINKPWNNKRVSTTLQNALKIRNSGLEIRKLKEKQKHLTKNIGGEKSLIYGESEIMKDLRTAVEKVAGTNANVLILGENGTGKELLAKEIHNLSSRFEEVFISVDLGSITETLFESEMFGYIKGAYTDAYTDKAGRFELASGGTLFLDEIGNLAVELQAKLLRVLQNKEISRLGSSIRTDVDFRLITATNKPLYDMVEENTFREDLLYRINTVQIDLPSLRSRKEDIPTMVECFLREFKKKYSRTNLTISNEAIDRFRKYSWPGNIRELRNIIEKTVIMSDSEKLGPDDFFFPETTKSKELESSYNLEANEKLLILRAMESFRGNMSQVSRELGVTRATLYRKIKKYGI